MTSPDPPVPRAALRQAVLALAVLDEVDLQPRDDGVVLAAGGTLGWDDVACALGPWAVRPDHPVTRRRLRLAAAVVGVVALGGADELLDACHAHGEPVGSTATDGDGGWGWGRERVPGGALVLGLGVSNLGGVVGPSPLPSLPRLHGPLQARLDARWVQVRQDLERLGGLLQERLLRDQREGRPLVLRPMGRADVVTLLGSTALRTALARGDGTGMRAVAVPVRSRGWFDLARIDPAYVGAAWIASEPPDRAFDRPLLVTADAVTAPVRSGDVLGAGVLADPAGGSLDRDLRRP